MSNATTEQPSSSIVSEQLPSVLPLPIIAADLRGFLDECGPSRVRGWAHRIGDADKPLMLSLCESGRELLLIEPNQWRADIAELRDGDGACGFDLPLPPELADGRSHILELCVADSGRSALAGSFRIHIRMHPSQFPRSDAPQSLQRLNKTPIFALSVIVNFYNMQREAARTLTSLSQAYQRNSDDLDYEVICIDNGSSPPLDPNWIASFGPQFRLIRPSIPHASPCLAINEAALQARGRYLAIMIDGAHLLTPGIFEEANRAWRECPDAVVAVRHWFIGGDQRWLASAGYTRAMEDKLFERIRWPANGYELFRIGAPIGENPEPWFDGLSESNCLMLPTELYDRIGGMDEAFDQAGGGFANLDLWRRASDSASGPLVSLIGEASFHQFHDGTTTNVEDAEKDVRVRAYANAYRMLRGEEFSNVHRSRLSFRGSIASEFAIGVRQRSLLPMRLGITERVRPGQLSLHFDEGAQTHLQSIYAECGLHEDVRWMGQPAGVAPADLITLQDIIHQIRPDAIIVVRAKAGLVGFIDDTLTSSNNLSARILCINPASITPAPSARVTMLQGPSAEQSMLATARHWTGSAETVMVLHSVDSEAVFSLESLQAYGDLVSHRSYMVCVGTLFGQPWLGYSIHHYLQTIRDFIGSNAGFVVDRSRTRQLISTCPSGYLRKVRGAITAASYDLALDELVAHPLAPEHAA